MIIRQKELLLTPFILSIVLVSNAFCQGKVSHMQFKDEKAHRYVSPDDGGTIVTNKDSLSKTATSSSTLSIDVPDALRSCQKDSECVDVPVVCGSCLCGTAVDRMQYEDYILLRTKTCGQTSAIACANGCAGKKAACVSEHCTLIEAALAGGSAAQP